MSSTVKFPYETLHGGPPSPPDGVELQLYSMEYCPFAERSRIALAFKGLPHHIVNCSLSDKPEFLVAANPNGQVPVLIHKGQAPIFESEVIVEYLDGAFPDLPQLYPKDPFARATSRQLSANITGKLIGPFYKLFSTLKERELTEEDKEAFLKPLRQWVEDKLSGSGFLVGNSLSFVDVLIWPWLHRMDTLSRAHKLDIITTSKVPKIVEYIQRMRQQECIKATLFQEENFLQLSAAYKKGEPLPYNLGSKHPFYAGKPKE